MHSLPLSPELTPQECALRLAGRPGLAWLDGGTQPAGAGRWSFVTSDPVEQLQAHEPRDALAVLDAAGTVPAGQQADGLHARLPRWIGHVSYAAHPDASALHDGGPLLHLARHDAVIAYDHLQGHGHIVGEQLADCRRLLALLQDGAQRPAPAARVSQLHAPNPAEHRHAVQAALEHIGEGDIYQVNLARCWHGRLQGEPLALFMAMRKASPVPRGFYQRHGDHHLLSRTMECFLDWEGPGGALMSRPIKGTIARRGDRDAEEAKHLSGDAKERAEHAMIVDLMRNDLSRVATLGSVRVRDVMHVEPYAGLTHLVSTVACQTPTTLGLGQLLQGTFPPGSVTGTPKLRAMQRIAELEPVARGPYCGAVGYLDWQGGCQLAVAIRTACVDASELRYWSGGGIVEASDVERELQETELKARVFLDAVQSLQADATAAGNG